MIEQTEIDAIREDAEQLLEDSCWIHERVSEKSEGGGTRDQFQRGGELACRIAPVGGGETGSAAGRVDDRTTHVATLPAETEIGESAQLEHNDVIYDVTAVRVRGFDELVRRVELVEAS